MTGRLVPDEAATSASARALPGSSATTVISEPSARRVRSRPRQLMVAIGEVIRMPRTRASASASASPMVAQEAPSAPAAIRRLAISGDLCDLACGRSDTPCRLAHAAIVAMFWSRMSRSTMSAGVSTSSRRIAIPEPIHGVIRVRGLPSRRTQGQIHMHKNSLPRFHCSSRRGKGIAGWDQGVNRSLLLTFDPALPVLLSSPGRKANAVSSAGRLRFRNRHTTAHTGRYLDFHGDQWRQYGSGHNSRWRDRRLCIRLPASISLLRRDIGRALYNRLRIAKCKLCPVRQLAAASVRMRSSTCLRRP